MRLFVSRAVTIFFNTLMVDVPLCLFIALKVSDEGCSLRFYETVRYRETNFEECYEMAVIFVHR